MIKLVVTDVDGTIVGKDEVLSEKMISFVQELQERGILYTIATGRVDGLVKDYTQKLGLTLPYVACNGGTVMQNGRVLVRKTIPLRLLKPVFEKADSMGMSLMYSIGGVEAAYRETPYVMQQQETFDRYHNPKGFTQEEWDQLQVDKVIVMAAVRDGSIGVIEEMLKELDGTIGYKRYADKAIDILNPEAVKEQGVRELARILGIPMEQVLFAGDDLNDIQSIREAGIGVAVANALDCVKEAADYVAGKPCYEGVMEAVRKFAWEEM